jgi:hypothetical protein
MKNHQLGAPESSLQPLSATARLPVIANDNESRFNGFKPSSSVRSPQL